MNRGRRNVERRERAQPVPPLAMPGPRRDAIAVERPPPWRKTADLTAAGIDRAFAHTDSFTVGVEEELLLVAPTSLGLVHEAEGLLHRLGRDRRFTRELRPCQLEIVTPVRLTASDACRELAAARRDLFAATGGDVAVLAAGTHPFSTSWGEITAAERYRQIADEYTWAAQRSLACGLHVHVAIDGADTALAAYNAFRSFLPELAALSGNSAIFEGRDTGMSSIRPKLNEAFPRAGVPPAFRSWNELLEFVEWGRTGGLFPDASHFWWDLRLHPVHGTLEVRAADAQTRVADAAAIVALIQALVARLVERHEAGEPPPVHPTHRIAENAWRANRYGVRGWLVDLDTGAPQPARARLARLIDDLEPYAERFHSAPQLADARTLLAGNGSDRQRYIFEREGATALTGRLVEETESSAADE